MVKTVKIANRDFPARLSMAAMRKFDEKFANEGISMMNMEGKELRTEHLASIAFFAIEAGVKFQGETLDIDIEWIYENIDISEIGIITEILGVEKKDAKKKK